MLERLNSILSKKTLILVSLFTTVSLLSEFTNLKPHLSVCLQAFAGIKMSTTFAADRILARAIWHLNAESILSGINYLFLLIFQNNN